MRLSDWSSDCCSSDLDLLEVLHPPQVPVLADRAQVEARHAERLGANLGVPAVEAPEVEIGRSVGQAPGLERVEIIDQKQEDVAIRRIERGRIRSEEGRVGKECVSPCRSG